MLFKHLKTHVKSHENKEVFKIYECETVSLKHSCWNLNLTDHVAVIERLKVQSGSSMIYYLI